MLDPSWISVHRCQVTTRMKITRMKITHRGLAICRRRGSLADPLPARSHQIRIELFCRSVRVLQLANGNEDIALGEHTISAGALEL